MGHGTPTLNFVFVYKAQTAFLVILQFFFVDIKRKLPWCVLCFACTCTICRFDETMWTPPTTFSVTAFTDRRFDKTQVGIWCQNYVISTSMRRNHVASTSLRRHFTSCFRWGGRHHRRSELLQSRTATLVPLFLAQGKLGAASWFSLQLRKASLYMGMLVMLLIVRTLNPKKCNFNAPAFRKNFFSKFDKYNILA